MKRWLLAAGLATTFALAGGGLAVAKDSGGGGGDKGGESPSGLPVPTGDGGCRFNGIQNGGAEFDCGLPNNDLIKGGCAADGDLTGFAGACFGTGAGSTMSGGLRVSFSGIYFEFNDGTQKCTFSAAPPPAQPAFECTKVTKAKAKRAVRRPARAAKRKPAIHARTTRR